MDGQGKWAPRGKGRPSTWVLICRQEAQVLFPVSSIWQGWTLTSEMTPSVLSGMVARCYEWGMCSKVFVWSVKTADDKGHMLHWDKHACTGRFFSTWVTWEEETSVEDCLHQTVLWGIFLINHWQERAQSTAGSATAGHGGLSCIKKELSKSWSKQEV